MRLSTEPTTDVETANVTLSWGLNNVRVFQVKEQYSGYLYFKWVPDSTWYNDTTFFHNFTDTVVTIKLEGNTGRSQGSTQIPGGTVINFPSFYSTLPIGATTCYWQSADRAEWYLVMYEGFAVGYTNNFLGWLPRVRDYTLDTSYIIPDEYLIYNEAKYYELWFYTCPSKGPLPVSGSTGNMTGDIRGYLVSEGFAHAVVFHLGTYSNDQTSSSLMYHEPTLHEKTNTYLEALRK